MAKGLKLVSEAIKPGCQQVDLILDSCKAIGVICKASGGTDEDDDAPLLPRPPPQLGGGCYPSTSVFVSTGGSSLGTSACSSLGS